MFDKLRLQAGDRLLDVGCGWGSMVRYAARRGVKTTGITLSAEQASWAQKAIAEEGLTELAEVRHGDYREIRETEFDAVSSIGLTEHIGVAHYPAASGFIDRYVFPDGEMTGSGRIITAAQDAGLEVLHEENLRPHYAMTLRDWCANLVEHWDEAVAEVGLGTARVWGLYMAGSRLGFERNVVQLHRCWPSTWTSGVGEWTCRCDRGGSRRPDGLGASFGATRPRSAAASATAAAWSWPDAAGRSRWAATA